MDPGNGLKSRNGWMREDRLLLLLVRGRLEPEAQDDARALLRQGLSWSYLVAQTDAHEVAPLVYRNLRALGFAGVPADAREELQKAYRVNAIRNTLMVGELSRLLTLLAGAGVPVIPLKGVALAESLYGDPALRVCADLDVLVPRESVPTAFRVLLENGYEHGEGHEVAPADIDLLLGSNIECAFVRRIHGFFCEVELHWDIAWRWQPDHRALIDLWEESRARGVWGANARALSPEWLLLYLAVHAARHWWRGLKWLVDIHEAASGEDVAWPKLLDKAAAFGLQEVLGVTLGVCRALFGTSVPPALSHPALPRWVALFPAEPPPRGIWHDALLPARLLGGRAERLRYLLRILLIPTLTERRILRLPSALERLYYPLRPARLACKGGGLLLRAGFRRVRNSRGGR